ncbi:MAG: FAD-binding protein, partial [bacterium]
WSNWSGRVRCRPSGLLEPSTQKELKQIVQDHYRKNSTLRLAGAGHSFTDLVKTNETIVTLRNFRGVTNHDSDKRTATIRAGTPLSE